MSSVTRIEFTLVIILIIFDIFCEPGVAQNRARRHRPKSSVAKSQPVDAPSNEESAAIWKQCSLPGRPKPEASGKMRMGGILCGKAVNLPKPSYPEEARAAKASGTVVVEVVIDEKGRVIWANAISGHPLLTPVATYAACGARFSPSAVSDKPVLIGGTINYNFQL